MPTPSPIIVASEVDQSGTGMSGSDEPGQHGADCETGDGDDDGQTGGDDAAEHDEQDEDRGGEADALRADRALLRLLDALAAERDLEAVRWRRRSPGRSAGCCPPWACRSG